MEAPSISSPVLLFFRWLVRWYFRLHFRAVRIAGVNGLLTCGEGPLIVYANHSSWWDPMVSVLLAEEYLPKRAHFAPMDAEALERNAILRRIGVFGVEMKTARGAAQFMRRGLAILQDKGVLWVTPQGRFSDVRERPLGLRRGTAELASRVPGGCTVIPLAVEYVYWNDRLPETLLQFGEPIQVTGRDFAKSEQLEQALLACMEILKTKAMARDANGFESVLSRLIPRVGRNQTPHAVINTNERTEQQKDPGSAQCGEE